MKFIKVFFASEQKVISGWICDILFLMTALAICTFLMLNTQAHRHTAHTQTPVNVLIVVSYNIEVHFK